MRKTTTRRVVNITHGFRSVLNRRVCCVNTLTHDTREAFPVDTVLGDVMQMSRARVRRRLGSRRFDELEEFLQSMGRSFGMEFPRWKKPDPLPPHP